MVTSAVVVRVGGLICGLPAMVVREVLPAMTPVRLPGAPAAVAGLLNIRGVILTVVDGAALLGRAREPADEGAVVLVESHGRRLGVLVGEVLDFAELPAATVASASALPGIDARYVHAVAPGEGGMVILLDLDALLGPLFGPNAFRGAVRPSEESR